MIGAQKGMQNAGGNPKFRKSGNLIRKKNTMVSKMGILRDFKNVEYSSNCIEPESEENSFITNLVAEILASEYAFLHKSLEFIVRSILVHFN